VWLLWSAYSEDLHLSLTELCSQASTVYCRHDWGLEGPKVLNFFEVFKSELFFCLQCLAGGTPDKCGWTSFQDEVYHLGQWQQDEGFLVLAMVPVYKVCWAFASVVFGSRILVFSLLVIHTDTDQVLSALLLICPG
jgi:hypothetical protein